MFAHDDDHGVAGDQFFSREEDPANQLDESMSPKAHKPKPLDQTFVPLKGKKYFSVVIGYPAMRRALRARGWIEVKCYKKLY